jgi:hypothetical protein
MVLVLVLVPVIEIVKATARKYRREIRVGVRSSPAQYGGVEGVGVEWCARTCPCFSLVPLDISDASVVQKFSKEVLYGPNGKPLYAFYARDDSGNAAAAVRKEGVVGKASSTTQEGRREEEDPARLSATDKEIERKVLFKLLREEEEAVSQLRAQQLEGKSAGRRIAGSWGASLLVSLSALVVPMFLLR